MVNAMWSSRVMILVAMLTACTISDNGLTSRGGPRVDGLLLKIVELPSETVYSQQFMSGDTLFVSPTGQDKVESDHPKDPTVNLELVPFATDTLKLTAETYPASFAEVKSAYQYDLTWHWSVWEFKRSCGALNLYSDNPDCWGLIVDTEARLTHRVAEEGPPWKQELLFHLPRDTDCAPGYRVGGTLTDANGKKIELPAAFQRGQARGIPVKRKCAE